MRDIFTAPLVIHQQFFQILPDSSRFFQILPDSLKFFKILPDFFFEKKNKTYSRPFLFVGIVGYYFVVIWDSLEILGDSWP